MEAPALRPPSTRLLLGETQAPFEYLRDWRARWALRRLPRGDGHPVMVFPGLIASDLLTAPLRKEIRAHGYAVVGWGLGVNFGLRGGLLNQMLTRTRLLADRHGRKATLVGWSLGGLYAREIAKRLPDRVRQVITIGTPSVGDLRANNAWRAYEALNDHSVDSPPINTDIRECPPVPITSIYSLRDGIVPPGAVILPEGEKRESVEVDGSHLGLPWNAEVIRIVLDRLAQPEGHWAPYAKGARPVA